MKTAEIQAALQKAFPDHQIQGDPLNAACLRVPVELVPQVFSHLKEESGLDFDYYEFCTATDRPPEWLEVVYSLYSLKHLHRLMLKVTVPRDNAVLPTLCGVWANAEWNEREVYDLFGVVFTAHPDLRRLMMPEDWEGHPLRKDYMHPNVVARPD